MRHHENLGPACYYYVHFSYIVYLFQSIILDIWVFFETYHNYLELTLCLTDSEAHRKSFYTMNFPFLKNSNSLPNWLEYLNRCAYFVHVCVCTCVYTYLLHSYLQQEHLSDTYLKSLNVWKCLSISLYFGCVESSRLTAPPPPCSVTILWHSTSQRQRR